MSKYLEYTRYANTGVTKAVAPVLGKFLNRDKLALEALCEEIRLNGGSPMDSETLLYILSGTIDYLREQFATKCVRYRFFGITFEVACYGPFETADAKFDPARNSLEVAVRLGEDLKNCLVNETPTLVTEETASTARIYRAMDIASGALGIYERVVSFVKFGEPPTIEKVATEGKDGIVKGEAFAATGSRLSWKDGDKVTVKWTEGGEEKSLEVTPKATAPERMDFDAVDAFEAIPDDTELTFEFELSGASATAKTGFVGA